MCKIVGIQDIHQNEWDALVIDSPVASWFQTSEAYQFYESLPFLESFVMGVESGGELKGVVAGYVQKDGGKLKQFFSRRAIINGGPLLASDIAETELQCLLQALRLYLKRKAIYIEMRNFNDYSCWQRVFKICGFIYEPHYDIWVDTSNMNVVNERLGKSRKRDIRMSVRDGATLVTQPTIDQVSNYYSILSELYRNRVKTPLFPLAFFEKLFKLPSSAFLLVEYKGEIVGGTICVALQGKVLYEMYACGKDGVYKNIFSSELATYAGLQFAAEHGISRFDMMGAGKPGDGGYGVRDFKLKFGGELVELGRYTFICNRLLYGIGKLGVKIMKK